MAYKPSKEPTVAKAQQAPQDPWFLILVTAPFQVQSIVAKSAFWVYLFKFFVYFYSEGASQILVVIKFLYSSLLRSANSVNPKTTLEDLSELFFSMKFRFSEKILNLSWSSDPLIFFPNFNFQVTYLLYTLQSNLEVVSFCNYKVTELSVQ